MHQSNVVMQKQYREKGFEKYFELINLLPHFNKITRFMKDQKAWSIGFTPFGEATYTRQTCHRGIL